ILLIKLIGLCRSIFLMGLNGWRVMKYFLRRQVRMSQLNPAEQASVEALEKLRACIDNNQCFRLEAGAGAGKTYSLIESIRYLIDNQAEEFLRREQKIACITYTNVAKDEIRDRT